MNEMETQKTLPDGWRWVKLGEMCEVNPRKPNGFVRGDDEGTSFVPMEAVDAGLKKVTRPQIRPYREMKKGYTHFTEGDVLFAKITPCMQNGKHFIAEGLIDGVGFASTEFHVLRLGASTSAQWVHFYLTQPAILQEATYHFTGTAGQQRVPGAFLEELQIPLPPLSEQKRIAAILKDQMAATEKARTAAQARLEAIKALPAAFLRQAFPQPDQPLPDGWRWVKLGEVVEFLDYKRKPVSEAERAKRNEGKGIHGLYPYYGANGQAGWIDSYLFDEPLILLAEDGGAFGSADTPIAYKIEGKTWVNNHAHVLRPIDGIDMEYCLAAIAIRPDLVHFATGSTRPKLNQSMATQIPFPLAPFPEQQHIAATLKDQMAAVEKARMAAEESLTTINALPAALLRRAFNGEI